MAEDTATIPTVDIDVLSRKRDAPHLEAILFADYAVKGGDGKATVAGIFDRIFIDPEKRTTGRFFVYVRTIDTLESPIDLRLIDPIGRVVATGSGTINDPAELENLPSPRSLTLAFPFGIQLGPKGIDGPYWFEVSYKGESLGGSVLIVEFRKKED